MPFRPSAHWPTNCKSLICNTGMAILLMDRSKHFSYMQYTWLAVGWKHSIYLEMWKMVLVFHKSNESVNSVTKLDYKIIFKKDKLASSKDSMCF